MNSLAKRKAPAVGQFVRSYSKIRLANRKRKLQQVTEGQLLDMKRSHSYTSLRDVVAASGSSNKFERWSGLQSSRSLPDIRHVHMKDPLVEKAARAYLMSAGYNQYQHHTSSIAASFSSLLRIVRQPFETTQRGFYTWFMGAAAWLKQLHIKY